MQNIVVLMLVNGFEIIAERLNDNNYKRTRRVHIVPGNQGEPTMTLVPWIWSDPDATVQISTSHIIATTMAPSDLSRAYQEQVSGIALSSGGLM